MTKMVWACAMYGDNRLTKNQWRKVIKDQK